MPNGPYSEIVVEIVTFQDDKKEPTATNCSLGAVPTKYIVQYRQQL